MYRTVYLYAAPQTARGGPSLATRRGDTKYNMLCNTSHESPAEPRPLRSLIFPDLHTPERPIHPTIYNRKVPWAAQPELWASKLLSVAIDFDISP